MTLAMMAAQWFILLGIFANGAAPLALVSTASSAPAAVAVTPADEEAAGVKAEVGPPTLLTPPDVEVPDGDCSPSARCLENDSGRTSPGISALQLPVKAA